MKKLLLLLIILSFIVIPLINASIFNLGTFEQNQNVTLIQTCSDCTYNNISSVEFPNGTIAVFNQTMIRDDTKYTLLFRNSTTLGTYSVHGYGDPGGIKDDWNYFFDITSTGDAFSTAGAIVLWLAVALFIVFGLFLFTGFTNKENKLPIKFTYLLASFLSFIASINFISIFMGSATTNQRVVSFFDSFTSIMFILFWFAFGLVAIMWGLTFFQTLMFK